MSLSVGNPLKDQLENLKSSQKSTPKVIPCVYVELEQEMLNRVVDSISSSLYYLSGPVLRNTYRPTPTDTKRLLADVEKVRGWFQQNLDYLVDEILGLSENPLIQSYRLSGGYFAACLSSLGVKEHLRQIYVLCPGREPLRIVIGSAVSLSDLESL